MNTGEITSKIEYSEVEYVVTNGINSYTGIDEKDARDFLRIETLETDGWWLIKRIKTGIVTEERIN